MVSARRLTGLMLFEAASLGVASAVHLTHGGSGAGVPEAVIGVVLVVGAVALWRAPARGRRAALGAVAFAIAGFVVGLTFTISGGSPGDLAYHATMLPLLVATAFVLSRGSRSHREAAR